METIHIDRQDGVATVKLGWGVTNALDLQRVEALAERLQALRLDPEVGGLVLSSANEKFFSIGFNIPQLYGLPKQDFETFYRAFNRLCLDLYTFPKPTIAAIAGHAIAGGCILTLCCDYRFIAQGRKLMGLNEIKLGVPVPYPADCILRHLVGERHARDVLGIGEFYQPDQLLAMGMVDQVLPLERVLPESIEKVRALGAMPRAAFAMIKHNRVETIQDQILARLEEKERFFIECWYGQPARQRLKEAMEKF